MASAAQLPSPVVARWRGRNQRSCSAISFFIHATVWCLATTALSQPAEAILGDILNPGGGGGGGAAITVSVSAPSTVSLCEVFLSVDASSTVSPTGATLSYDWSVSGDLVSSITINAALALLPSSASVAQVASALLLPGVTYTFTVDVTDADGGSGSGSVAVTPSSLAIPVVSALVPVVQTVQRSEDTHLRVGTSVSDCVLNDIAGNVQIGVVWSQVSGPNVSLVVDSNDPRHATVPAGTLAVGSQYVFRSAVAVVGQPLLSSFLDFTIAGVLAAALVAAVEPLTSEVSTTEALTLDAGNSFDPDAVSGVVSSWTWSCVVMATTAPCAYSNGTTVPMPSGQVVTLAPGLLPNNLVDQLLRFVVVYTAGLRNATTFVETTLRAAVPRVTSYLTPQVPKLPNGDWYANPSAQFVLASHVSVNDNATASRRLLDTRSYGGRSLAGGVPVVSYAWSVDGGALDLGGSGVVAGSSADQLLVINPGVLTPGQSYGFRLVATAVDSILETVLGTSTSLITVLTNSPPAGGALAVTPANGTELETVFTLQASGWTDDAGDLPLSYSFSRLPGRFPVAAPQLWFPAAVKDAAGAVLNFQSLSSPLAVSRLSTILPVGDLVDGGATTLQVLVSDAFSAVSRVAAVVNVSRILDTIDQPLDLTALVAEQLGLVDAALAALDIDKAFLLLTNLVDLINADAGVDTSIPVTDLPCASTTVQPDPNDKRTAVLSKVLTVSNVITLDTSRISQLSMLNAQLTAVPSQLDSDAIWDSLQIASQSLTAPASVVMDELSAIVNIVTMSNIVTAQLLQQVNSTAAGAAGSASSLVVEPGIGLERCLCSRSPFGVRSCTCPDAEATEQESARVWLEVARIVDGVSARRLPELVPNLAAIPMTSCRIDVMLEVKTLAALASSTLSVPASKEAGNLVASVKLPADIANVPGLLNGTTANEATLRYRVVRWLDDPFQFASLGNPAAVASQVLSVDFLNNDGVIQRVDDLATPAELVIPWDPSTQPDDVLTSGGATESHTCTAADVARGYANVTHMCDGLLFPFAVLCNTTGAAVEFACPGNATSAAPVCTYWQDSATDNSTWSTEGCQLVYATPSHIVCACTHFTDFASAWTGIGGRATDVLGSVDEFSTEKLVENIPLVVALIALLILAIMLICTARAMDAAEPPPAYKKETKDPALNRRTLTKLTHVNPLVRAGIDVATSAAAAAGAAAFGVQVAGDMGGASGGWAGRPTTKRAIPRGWQSSRRLQHQAGKDVARRSCCGWLCGELGVLAELMRHRHPWCSLTSRKGVLGRTERVMLMIVSLFVSLAVLALQYDVEGVSEQGSSWLSVDFRAVLINSSVAACVAQPVRQLVAALMRHLGTERQPVRQLTEPETMLREAASVAFRRLAFAQIGKQRRLSEAARDDGGTPRAASSCCCCCGRSRGSAATQQKVAPTQSTRMRGVVGTWGRRRSQESDGNDFTSVALPRQDKPKATSGGFEAPVLPPSELARHFSQLGWFQKSLYRNLIPPSQEELDRPRRPRVWACVAYTTAALVVLFCAFFVLAFGFRFGADVSRAYMISAAVSFVLGGLVVQPLSILLFSSIRYRLFRAFVTQHVIPGFRPADGHHFQKVVLNDGAPTALAALLVANSVRDINEVESAWDDDTGNKRSRPPPPPSTVAVISPAKNGVAAAAGGEQRAPRAPLSVTRRTLPTSDGATASSQVGVSRRQRRAQRHPGQLRAAAFEVEAPSGAASSRRGKATSPAAFDVDAPSAAAPSRRGRALSPAKFNSVPASSTSRRGRSSSPATFDAPGVPASNASNNSSGSFSSGAWDEQRSFLH